MSFAADTHLGPYKIISIVSSRIVRSGQTAAMVRSDACEHGSDANFDLATDGKRLVALMPAETTESRETQSHVTLELNFFEEVGAAWRKNPGSLSAGMCVGPCEILASLMAAWGKCGARAICG